MSDQSLLLAAPEELPLEEEDEVPSEDTSPDEPVASSDTSEFLTESTDTEDDQNQASDEWKQMWSAKRGESAEPQVVTENAFNDAVSQVINGINITYNNAGGAPGRRKSTSAPISHDRLEKNSRVYVPPSNGLDQALNVLVERRVLILFGERRMGKKAAALHLIEIKHRASEISVVSPDVDLDDEQALAIEPQRGYLIDSLSPESAAKLSAFVLQRLDRQLEAQNSHLAITVNRSTALDHAALSDYVVVWDALPERKQILKSHLAWLLDDEIETLRPSAQALCEHDAVKRVLATLEPARIDTLATLLVDVVAGKYQLEEALRRFSAGAMERIATWFRDHEGLEQRTFMIALAVFSGAKYQSVVDAGKQFLALIRGLPAAEIASSAQEVFDSVRSDVLREAKAKIIYTEEQAVFGTVRTERVVLDDHALRFAVLDHIWKEYDGLRKHLLTWIRGVGLRRSTDIREWAAWAAAQWGRDNLTDVLGTVLLPWARHTDSRVRRSAALALEIMASDPNSARQALGLLKHWSMLRNSWRICWTAAAAYGGSLAAQAPEDALRDLRNIAHAGDARLRYVVTRGIANLFEAAQTQPLLYERVLCELNDWTADPKTRGVMLTGLLIFVNLAQEAKIRYSDQESDSPALLQLSTDPTCSRQICTLWRRALNHQVSREKALAALRGWLQAADRDPALLPPLTQLIADLVGEGDERERQRLRYWLARWADDHRQPCAAAGSISATIGRDSFAKEARV